MSVFKESKEIVDFDLKMQHSWPITNKTLRSTEWRQAWLVLQRVYQFHRNVGASIHNSKKAWKKTWALATGINVNKGKKYTQVSK